MKNIIKQAVKTNRLSYSELVQILKDESCNDYLFKAADYVRKCRVGDEVHLRGLIEFTNICAKNCMYCGIRRDNSFVERYAMTPEEIFETAKRAHSLGYKTVVLQSGETQTYSIETLCEIIRKIKTLDIAVTLSIGEKNEDEYRALKEAGADRYLLRIETTSSRLYQSLHPEMSLMRRKACLYFLKKIGFEVGTGDLIGLPNQKDEQIADDLLFFQELDADMVGLGPFIPNSQTPLKDEVGGTFEKALKVMALARILLPSANIPATTAMETLNPNGRIIALQSGANVVMPNVNDTSYRSKYQLYPGKICLDDGAEKCRKCIEGKITAIGRTIATSKGFRIKNGSVNQS